MASAHVKVAVKLASMVKWTPIYGAQFVTLFFCLQTLYYSAIYSNHKKLARVQFASISDIPIRRSAGIIRDVVLLSFICIFELGYI